jgi:hypothetical protein
VVTTPHPNPETVEVLWDTTWRIADAEASRTDALDRKAASVATFASLVTSLTATLGIRFLERVGELWALLVFWGSLFALVISIVLAVAALFPREYVTLGMRYIEGFPTWAEIRKRPEQVRGETMEGLVEAVARERKSNDRKAVAVKWGLVWLAAGLTLIAVEAATLATVEAL